MVVGDGSAPPPGAFLCPISQEVMGDPVFAADGHSYERAQIEGWFAIGKCTSPMTNDEMEHQVLVPNHLLKAQISDWKGRSNAERVADIVAAIVLAVTAPVPKSSDQKVLRIFQCVG